MRLECYNDRETLATYYPASPLGLIDKADGTKRRIHHLSNPPENSSSINLGIPVDYGALAYSTLDDAIQAIQKRGQHCLLVKRDWESAFSAHPSITP